MKSAAKKQRESGLSEQLEKIYARADRLSAERAVDFRAMLAAFPPPLQRALKRAAHRNGWAEDDKRLHVEIVRDTLAAMPRINNGQLFTPATAEQLVTAYGQPREQAT